MALYAIGDLHLSIGTGKSMEVFGHRWQGYMEKIKQGFSLVQPEDTVVLCGDICWGMTMDQAKEEFAYVNQLPGKKI
ncbi:MAG: serine/threonine protein phosphatase, partial [Oscillospiraceae bacterium]|nr:serine/threonine protein phosphatase [Oscillospiraceae bacterium]